MTKEYRDQLSVNAKKAFDQFKDKIKVIQNKYYKDASKKDGKLSDDIIHNGQLRVKFNKTFIPFSNYESFSF